MTITALDRLLEDTLTVKYVEGGISTVACPYTTGTRTLPYAVVAQWLVGGIRYERAGEPPLRLPEGVVLLTPSAKTHSVTTLAERETSCRWAHLHLTICGGLDLLRFLQAPVMLTGAAADRLGELCVALAHTRVATELSPLARVARTRLLEYTLLDVLLSLVEWPRTVSKNMQSIGQVLPVLVYIQEHFTGDISRDTLARVQHLSPAQFHVVFKQAMGMTPLEYVTLVRIRQAQTLLLQTGETVAGIATRVGFHDPFHFSRQFRARCGCSPLQYRRQTLSLPLATPAEA